MSVQFLVEIQRLKRSPAHLHLPDLVKEYWAKQQTIPTVTREDISVLKNDWLTDNVRERQWPAPRLWMSLTHRETR
jgi:hypothetical protein